MANVVIDIATEFTGKKGFKQAETATDKLSKNVKKLAGALGLAFGGQAILAYGKAAVKAAAADEKAQKQLALALKNVGLGRDAAASEDYIQKLQSEFGILDDKLRPAYQTLAVATRDSAEAQRLLNLALNISASTGKDLASTSSALSKAFLGNNTALSKLGVGISKADLKAGKFEDIIANLETTFAGAATQSANTFQGSIDKLGVAAANASEIIGTGLIDALKGLGDQDSVDNLAKSMQDVATYTADVIRGIGVMVEKLKGLPGVSFLDVQMIPIIGSYISALNAAGKASKGGYGITAQGLAHLAELQARYTAKILKDEKLITNEDRKQLAAAKLKAAIDKANLALNKGEGVFDLDKIQVAAALTNQAEALGRVTNGAQVLQIANDTARLRVKQSIAALEDAIASKDEAAITRATAKLNEDLKILGALSGQNVKLADIKSILDSLVPKDLINQANLDEALAKIKEMLALLALVKTPTATTPSGGGAYSTVNKVAAITAKLPSSVTATDFFNSLKEDEQAQLGGYQPFVGATIPTTVPYDSGGSGVGFGNNGSGRQVPVGVTINVNTGIGDPNAIAEAISQVVQDAVDRGTLRGGLTPV